ncbi:MAG TPA: YdcF family protein [Terriglobales bacterium]|nr:YdcF family protein [Terriglobales bacterium]
MTAVPPPVDRPARQRTTAALLVVALLVFVIAAGLVRIASLISRQAGQNEIRPADAIVVFGAAEYSGHPSPVYRARLEHAFSLFEKGIAPVVITTGGAAEDPTYSEGGVGRDFLARRGIPDVNLIAETQGGNTAESAARVAVIMKANGMRTALVVSDAYHIFRIKAMMAKEGIEAYGAPRPDSLPHSPWGRIEGVVREAMSYSLWRLHIT